MKSKLIIIIFNVFILISFSSLFFLPINIIGISSIMEFWRENWYLPLFLLILILMINLFFASNWKILEFVEKGKWNDLIFTLEDKIFKKKKITYTYVSLLTHAYLLKGLTKPIFNLEQQIKKINMPLYNKTFLIFAATRILIGDINTLGEYLKEALNNKEIIEKRWITLFYAFVLISEKKHDNALSTLKTAEKIFLTDKDCRKKTKHDPVYTILWIYFYALCAADEEKEQALQFKAVFSRELSETEFESIFEREKREIHILLIAPIIIQAKEWLYRSI